MTVVVDQLLLRPNNITSIGAVVQHQENQKQQYHDGKHRLGVDLSRKTRGVALRTARYVQRPCAVDDFQDFLDIISDTTFAFHVALNNLLQRPTFTAYQLSQIAHQLDALELEYMAQNNEGGTQSADYIRRVQEGSSNVDEAGNFSIQVLKAALDQEKNIKLEYLNDQILAGRDITDMQGFICHKSDHWFAMRNIGGRFWNLNSTFERPQAVSHFALATEMQQAKEAGYTIFAIPAGLPPVGQKFGSAGENWHKMSDLLQGKSTQSDPWEKLQGRGMRLDGNSNSPNGAMAIDGLTEEEQIALAMQQSLEPPAPATRVVTEDYTIPDEPPKGEKGSCRIQLRLPDGNRMVRPFRLTDKVGGIYAVVASKCSGRAFTLLAGFPPKDLDDAKQKTISEAGLAGDSIQGRFV